MHRIKYFITGGGTGGHIYPALAVIREFVKSGVSKDGEIFYLGNKNNLEYSVAQSEGLKFLSYDVSGMPRKFSPKIFVFAFKLIIASFKALFYALRYRPDVVFATGGYVCAPILIAAKILSIPYVLHDCDAHPGVVSRIFSHDAYALSLAFESAKEYTRCKNIHVLGNPIREDFKTLTKEKARELLDIKRDFVILIMGGSSGAKKINDASFELVKKYKDNPDTEIIWQTGKKNYEEVRGALERELGGLPSNVILKPYFENMAIPLKASDVAISRSGSLSLSELCAAGLPSLLVPYPYAAADHQRINARKMCEMGASVYLDDNDCSGQKLLETFENFVNDKNSLERAAKCAKDNAGYDASREIVLLINQAALTKKQG